MSNINNSVDSVGRRKRAQLIRWNCRIFVIGDAVNPLLVLSVSVLHTGCGGLYAGL